MFKRFYNRVPISSSVILVLILIEISRMLDTFAWMPDQAEKTRIILINSLFEFISFLPFTFLLIYSYLWAMHQKKYRLLLPSIILVFVVLGPAMVSFLSTWLSGFYIREHIMPFSLTLIKRFTPGGAILFLVLSATIYLSLLKLQYTKQQEAAFKAENLAKDVQLKMLRYQINPHFLFNVLNSIHALIDENTQKAKKLIVEMSEYYRYTLSKQQHTITIREEMDAIVKYLEIQKIRFEERLEYEISVDNAVHSVFIPSFVIHLLIENAVKYGMKSNDQTLKIRLSASLMNHSLLLRVSNTGKLLEPKPLIDTNQDGTGHGIENIKNRLSLFYGDNYSFSLDEENGWVVARVEIKNIQPI